MNQEQQHLTKLLAPLIVFIVLIIVLTLVFHERSRKQKHEKKKQTPALEMRLDRSAMETLSFSRKKEIRQDFSFPKAEEILSNARKKALKRENDIVEEAKEEAARILARANNEIELEKNKLQDEIKVEIVKVAAVMAGKMIKMQMDESMQNALIQDTLKEMGDDTWLSK